MSDGRGGGVLLLPRPRKEWNWADMAGTTFTLLVQGWPPRPGLLSPSLLLGYDKSLILKEEGKVFWAHCLRRIRPTMMAKAW